MCPNCNHKIVKRINRSLIQKIVLPNSKRYYCKKCKTKFLV